MPPRRDISLRDTQRGQIIVLGLIISASDIITKGAETFFSPFGISLSLFAHNTISASQGIPFVESAMLLFPFLGSYATRGGKPHPRSACFMQNTRLGYGVSTYRRRFPQRNAAAISSPKGLRDRIQPSFDKGAVLRYIRRSECEMSLRNVAVLSYRKRSYKKNRGAPRATPQKGGIYRFTLGR